MKSIAYRKTSKYKYSISGHYAQSLNIRLEKPIAEPPDTSYIVVRNDGFLIIKEGYAWDGPFGPTIDTKSFMRGSLVHDALYQLMRAERLPRKDYKDFADRLLRDMCKQDGMSSLRSWYVYWGVRLFGKSSTREKRKMRRIITAP